MKRLLFALALAGLGVAQQAGQVCLLDCRLLAIGCVLDGTLASDLPKLMKCVLEAAATDIVYTKGPNCRKCMIMNACPLAAKAAEIHQLDLDAKPCEANYCNPFVQTALKDCIIQEEDPCKGHDYGQEECEGVNVNGLRLCTMDDNNECVNRMDYVGGPGKNKNCEDKGKKRAQCGKLEGCRWDLNAAKCIPFTEPEKKPAFENYAAYQEFLKTIEAEDCEGVGGSWIENQNKCKVKRNGAKCKSMKDEGMCKRTQCKWRKPKTNKKGKTKGGGCKNSGKEIFPGNGKKGRKRGGR